MELDGAPGAERVHGQLTRTEATATGIGPGDRVWVRAHPGADVLRS